MVDKIGFPPPLLGSAPVRLSVHHRGGAWILLEKPVGASSRAHPWYPGVPDLDRALNHQWASGKPELRRLFGGDPHANARFFDLFFLEPEISGAALFALGDSARAVWRNAYGSRLLSFRFELLVHDRDPPAGHRRDCSLPLADDPERAGRARVSHRRGKRCHTRFRRLAENPAGDGPELWVAETRLFRPHQVRLHAAECGLAVSGDATYGVGDPVFREAFYRRRTAEATPVYPAPAVILRSFSWPELSGSIPAEAVGLPRPDGFARLIKLLGFEAGPSAAAPS